MEDATANNISVSLPKKKGRPRKVERPLTVKVSVRFQPVAADMLNELVKRRRSNKSEVCEFAVKYTSIANKFDEALLLKRQNGNSLPHLVEDTSDQTRAPGRPRKDDGISGASTSVHLAEERVRDIDDICQNTGLNRSRVIELCIRNLFQAYQNAMLPETAMGVMVLGIATKQSIDRNPKNNTSSGLTQ